MFRRQSTGQSPESVADSYNVPTESPRVDWKRAVPRLLAAALVLALVVWGVVWAIGEIGNDKPSDKKQPGIAQSDNRSAGSSSSKNEESGMASSGENAASSGSSAASGTSPAGSSQSGTPATPGKSTASDSSQLSDTGPGDVVIIFAAATATGVAVYQVRLRRFASSSAE